MRQIRADNPGMTEACLDKLHWGGVLAWEPDDPACYEMLPDQRWSGLWDSGWEWSNFCPDPAKRCEASNEQGDIWLTFAEGTRPRAEIPWGLYRVEFVGRRSKVPGHFGHLDQYDHLMVVDRVISIEKIPGEKYTKR